jgi:hypothetical protein
MLWKGGWYSSGTVRFASSRPGGKFLAGSQHEPNPLEARFILHILSERSTVECRSISGVCLCVWLGRLSLDSNRECGARIGIAAVFARRVEAVRRALDSIAALLGLIDCS